MLKHCFNPNLQVVKASKDLKDLWDFPVLQESRPREESLVPLVFLERLGPRALQESADNPDFRAPRDWRVHQD